MSDLTHTIAEVEDILAPIFFNRLKTLHFLNQGKKY